MRNRTPSLPRMRSGAPKNNRPALAARRARALIGATLSGLSPHGRPRTSRNCVDVVNFVNFASPRRGPRPPQRPGKFSAEGVSNVRNPSTFRPPAQLRVGETFV